MNIPVYSRHVRRICRIGFGLLVCAAAVCAQSSVCAEFSVSGYVEEAGARRLRLPAGTHVIRGMFHYNPAPAQGYVQQSSSERYGAWVYSQGLFQFDLAGRVWKTPATSGGVVFSISTLQPADPPDGPVTGSYRVNSTVADGSSAFPALGPIAELYLTSWAPLFGMDDAPATVPEFSAFSRGQFSVRLDNERLVSGDITAFQECSAATAEGRWPPPHKIEPPSAAAAFKTLVVSDQPQKIKITARPTGNPDSSDGTLKVVLYSDAELTDLKPMGQMFDDGTHGDEIPSDGVYTAEVEITERSSGLLIFGASAKFADSPEERSFPIAFVTLRSDQTCLSALGDLAARLERGEMEAASAFFQDLGSRDIVLAISAEARQTFASALRKAVVQESEPGECTLAFPYTTGGKTTEQLITFGQQATGEWLVIEW